MSILKPAQALFYSTIFCLLWAGPSDCRKKPGGPVHSGFDRAEFMVMNLNRGKDSTGYYLQESLEKSRTLSHDLEKGQRQLEQVDKAYARSRGRPDDKFLVAAGDSIAKARATAVLLARQLKEAHDELAYAIKNVLLLEK